MFLCLETGIQTEQIGTGTRVHIIVDSAKYFRIDALVVRNQQWVLNRGEYPKVADKAHLCKRIANCYVVEAQK